MDKFWKQFKSGTDIRGVASEGVAGQKINLTDEVAGACRRNSLRLRPGVHPVYVYDYR